MAVVNQVGNALTGSTGTGAFVGDNTPTLVTPNIGAATGTSLSVNGAIASTASTITAGTNVFLTQAAATGRLVSLTGNQTNTGQLNLQAGPGSATYGGAMTLYGNAHATLPGYVNIGLSNNASTPKFTITSNPFSGGSEVFSVNNVGTTIVAGLITATTGINFGDENLSTYDTGTWQPTFTFATPGDISVVYGSQTGSYTRIGRMVIASFYLRCTPTFTTSSGAARIGGLPVAANASADGATTITQFMGSATPITWPSTSTMVSGVVTANQQYMTIAGNGSGIIAQTFAVAQFTSAAEIQVAGVAVYQTA